MQYSLTVSKVILLAGASPVFSVPASGTVNMKGESPCVSRSIAQRLVPMFANAACLLKMSSELFHEQLPEYPGVLLQALEGDGYLCESFCSAF